MDQLGGFQDQRAEDGWGVLEELGLEHSGVRSGGVLIGCYDKMKQIEILRLPNRPAQLVHDILDVPSEPLGLALKALGLEGLNCLEISG